MIKLLEDTTNGGNGALIRSTAILWTSDQHFILFTIYRGLWVFVAVDHLRIYILCLCWRAPLCCQC